MQEEYLLMVANSCQKINFADSLSSEVQFPQAALQRDDARTSSSLIPAIAVSSRFLQFFMSSYSV